MRRAVIFLVVLAAVIAGAVWIAGRFRQGGEQPDAAEKKTFEVRKGNLLVTISETGELKAQNSTRIRSDVDREVKIVFLAAEGSRVKKGDELVRFDTTEIDRQIESDTQAVDAAQANYDASRVDFEIQTTDWENEIARAELSHDEAVKNLEKYEKGELPLKQREHKVKLEEAESNLARAREKLAQMPDLLKEGFVTPDQVEQKKIEVKKAEVASESAKSELQLFEKYTKPLELEKKKAAIGQTKVSLEATKKRVEAKTRQKKTDLDSQKVNLDTRKANLEKLKEERKRMVITAPTDGLVIYGEPGRRRWGGDEIKVGMQVWQHQTIITLPDLSRMQATLRIHEMDITRVRIGMEVTVTVESAGEASFSGKITKVAELANAGGWRSDPEVKQFDVEVTLDGTDLGLKPGTTAKVEIVLDQLSDVLFVPIPAVRGIGERLFCYVETDGGFVRKETTLGLSNDKFVEIRSGLSAGDRVLVARPSQELLAQEEKEREKLSSAKAGGDTATTAAGNPAAKGG
jgi:HlyD family secretion protein